MTVRAQQRARRSPAIDLQDASDEALLLMRLCDLPVQLGNSLMSRRVARLQRELAARNIVARPHVWLSEEFFTPDRVLGFAVPFYLAHPRLMRLERSQMFECEGASEAECRRIFRHEAGHALEDAYALGKRPRYRELFGDPDAPYPDNYKPRVDSRDHVINLAGWYAQAHPVEDFHETFAVWLNPYVDWRTTYKGWPALEKLDYVDELMKGIAGRQPVLTRKTEVEPQSSLRLTLKEHYVAKRARRLPEGRPMTVAASKALRVLLLTDENLIPDKPRSKLKGRDAELRKTEYDVLDALKKLGHQVTCAGVASNLSVVRRAILRNKPHVVFNLVEQFDGLPVFDQHVVSYLELRAQKYTGCDPRGLTLARDKALTKKILAYHRLPVARFAVFKPRKKIVVSSRLKFPMFVKSLTDEGSEGIAQASLARDHDRLIERIAFIHEKSNSAALVEEFIEGREIYVGVYGNERCRSGS